MPRIRVAQIIANMRLSEDVFDMHGVLLLPEGTRLTLAHMDFLHRKHVEEVAIYEIAPASTSFSYAFNACVDHFKDIYESVRMGRVLVGKDVEEVFESVLDEISMNPKIMDVFMVLDGFDQYTYEHSVKVSILAALVGQWLHLDFDTQKNLVLAGLFHDLGKANVPIELIMKSDTLSDSEYGVVKQHSFFGYVLCKDVFDENPEVLAAIRDHHERLDGSGYPAGAVGEEVGFLTQIVAICDIFSAATQTKPYKIPKSPLVVMRELWAEKLDGELVEVFLKNAARYFEGLKVGLSNGAVAEIVKVDIRNPERPLVAFDTKHVDLRIDNTLEILFVHNG